MNWQLIKQDFASFSDPGTTINIDQHVIGWTRDRRTFKATLIPGAAEYPDILFDGKQYAYVEFFASEYMADLRSLAESIPPILAAHPAYAGDAYVDSQITLEDEERSDSASTLLPVLAVQASPSGNSKVVFLRGRAGDGKSTLLVQLSTIQAKSFLQGDTTWLYFYVNAQGSALAKIDEVLAKVSQDFRTRFTYHAISTLTRLALLVPIIDGFDELLGASGYKDAFSSLSLFLSRLDGRGSVIASARSTFYQYASFSEQASRFATDDNPLHFEIIPAILNPWREVEAKSFLDKTQGDWSVQSIKDRLGGRATEVLSSPFLLSTLSKLKSDLSTFSEHGDLLRFVVEQMVRREMVEKLLDPQGKPLLTLEQHLAVVGAISEEMWWQETRELDEQTFFVIAELVCDELGLVGDIARRFLDRVPSYALLMRFESPPRIAFRHEFYFAYFLGARIGDLLRKRQNISTLIERATIPATVAEEIAASIKSMESPDVAAIASLLSKRGSDLRVADIARTNSGTLIWAFVKQLSGALQGVSFSDANLFGLDLSSTTLKNVEFHGCTFTQCDFRAVQWSGIRFDDCHLYDIVVDKQTKLHSKGLRLNGDVVGVRLTAGGKSKEVFALDDIQQILSNLGVEFLDKKIAEKPLSTKANGMVEKLNQFLRIPKRTLYFSESDFQIRGHNLQGDLKEVFNFLQKHGLVISVPKERRGSRAIFRLTVSADEIRRGEAGIFSSTVIKKFWNEISSL